MTSICDMKKGFTLVELLVVVGMIAIVIGSLTTSVSGARQRAKLEKARAEVKSITQAILAAENYKASFLNGFDRPQELNADNLRFLLGGENVRGDKMPVLLMAALNAKNTVADPWGSPYRVVIKMGTMDIPNSTRDIDTGFTLPNFHRLSEGERK